MPPVKPPACRISRPQASHTAEDVPAIRLKVCTTQNEHQDACRTASDIIRRSRCTAPPAQVMSASMAATTPELSARRPATSHCRCRFAELTAQVPHTPWTRAYRSARVCVTFVFQVLQPSARTSPPGVGQGASGTAGQFSGTPSALTVSMLMWPSMGRPLAFWYSATARMVEASVRPFLGPL